MFSLGIEMTLDVIQGKKYKKEVNTIDAKNMKNKLKNEQKQKLT